MFLRSLAARRYPKTFQLLFADRYQARAAFYRAEGESTFFEVRLLNPLLLTGPPRMPGRAPIPIKVMPDSAQMLATGSTVQAAPIADLLSRGIQEQLDDGSLGRAADR